MTHFMYTPPLPPVGALSAMPTLHVALVGLGFAVAAFAMFRRPKPVPVLSAYQHPVFCERTRRWRDPVTRRFVKSPR